MYDSLCVLLVLYLSIFGIVKLGLRCAQAQLVLIQHFACKSHITLHCVTLICQLLDCNETQWGGCVTVWGFLIIEPPMLHCLNMSESTSEVLLLNLK